MKVTDYSWGPAVQNEALKCWFYALLASIILSFWDLSSSVFSAGNKGQTTRYEQSELLSQLVSNGCDILIPGSAVGWLSVSQSIIGNTMIVSTLLSGYGMWKRQVR